MENPRIRNIRLMADDLLKCPANEQNIANLQGVIAQALRDIADELAWSRELLEPIR